MLQLENFDLILSITRLPMNVSFSLFRLQSLDTQRFQIARKLSEIDSILSQDEQVQAALQARNQAESSRKQAQDTLERVLRQVTEKKTQT